MDFNRNLRIVRTSGSSYPFPYKNNVLWVHHDENNNPVSEIWDHGKWVPVTGVGSGSGDIIIDTKMSDSSSNAIANKTVKKYVDGIASKTDASILSLNEGVAALQSLIDTLNPGYQFMGVATPETNPGTPDQKVFYIANGKSTYPTFGGIEVTEDEVVILYYDTAWHKLLTGIASQDKLTELDKVINGDGEVTITPTAGSNFVAEIDVEEGDTIAISATASVALTQNSYITLLMGGTQIYNSSFILKTETSGTIPPYHVTSSGKVTIKFSYNEYTENTITFSISPSIPGLVNELSELKTQVDSSSGAIDEIQDTIDGEVKPLSPDEIVNGYYRVITGEIAPHESYFYTNPIPVKKGDVIATTEAMSLSPQISYLSAVTSSNGFIKSLVGGTTETKVLNYVIEEDGYISICYIKARTYIFLHKKIGLKGQVDSLNEDLSNLGVETDTHLPIITDNPLSKIMRDAGYGGIIRKWGFVGDSYSSGETPAKLNGVLTNDMDMYALSWGQQLMRIIGAEGYNFSNGGQTAKGWIRRQGTIHDASYIGGVGGGDWELAKQAGNLKQAYIISLGINDQGKIASGTPYLGDIYTLGDVDIDVNLNDYTQNNENTWAGCYAGIIQRIKSVQPKAKIFCITQFGNALEPLNDVVRQMPSLFSNVYVLDFYQYAFDFVHSGVAGYMSYGHPTPLGYQYMAYLANTYIDYIIRTDMASFEDVSLIGTDYTL